MTTGGVLDSILAADGGHYQFKVSVTEQIRYRVWSRGNVGCVHPHIKTCEKSRRSTVTINVI